MPPLLLSSGRVLASVQAEEVMKQLEAEEEKAMEPDPSKQARSGSLRAVARSTSHAVPCEQARNCATCAAPAPSVPLSCSISTVLTLPSSTSTSWMQAVGVRRAARLVMWRSGLTYSPMYHLAYPKNPRMIYNFSWEVLYFCVEK